MVAAHRKAVAAALRRLGPSNVWQVAKAAGLPPDVAQVQLLRLLQRGLVGLDRLGVRQEPVWWWDHSRKKPKKVLHGA